MPSYTATDTAAEAAVGRDILASESWARTPRNRALTHVAYTGSAVVGDTSVDVFVDEVRVGSFFNSALLTPQANRDLQPVGPVAVPAGSALRCVVTDAAATSPIFVMVVLSDL
jgi:hypothetical protein